MKRYLSKYIAQDLEGKMVFLGGPRQVGKTTLALSYLKPANEKSPAYLNWDSKKQQKQLLAEELPSEEKLIILDEVHKYRRWRNLVKGLYDTHKSSKTFLITGSARLDYYRRGGDSLQGRYHYYRLHPLSIGELGQNKNNLEQLLNFGGFPEPYFKKNKRFWRRWQRERITRVIKEDLLSLERIQEVTDLEMLVDLLPNRVGSPLSIQSLASDLEVAHKTVKRWLIILENLYLCFRISPFGSPKIRAVKKEQKLYLWDWSLVENEGAKFENLVASQLLKYCHFLEDTEGHKMELRYLRDTDKREVDFVVIKDKKPLFAVEVKSSETNIDPNLKYFSERVDIPHYYQVHKLEQDYTKGSIRVLPFGKFVELLGMP